MAAQTCVDPVLPYLQAALACLIEQLAACGRPVAFASLVPGASPDLLCCSDGDGDGRAWVSVTSISPEFIDVGATCSWSYRVAALMGVERCGPTVDNQGGIADQELDDAATTVLLDARAMRAALVCCWPETVGIFPQDWTPGVWSQIPPGDCVGGTQSWEFSFSDCGCQ